MSQLPLWLRHYSLERPPFAKELSDGELWLPSSKMGLLDTMVEALDERQHVLLTGEPGMGKTCLLRALRKRLPEAGFRLTYCHNATLGRRDFYRQLCLALGLHPKATAAAVFNAVAEHVEQLSRERRHPVFLLDESQLLKQEVLEHLHVLCNYDFDSKPLLSLVARRLAGPLGHPQGAHQPLALVTHPLPHLDPRSDPRRHRRVHPAPHRSSQGAEESLRVRCHQRPARRNTGALA